MGRVSPQKVKVQHYFHPIVVAVIPDPRAARSLRFSFARTVNGYHPSTPSMTFHMSESQKETTIADSVAMVTALSHLSA